MWRRQAPPRLTTGKSATQTRWLCLTGLRERCDFYRENPVSRISLSLLCRDTQSQSKSHVHKVYKFVWLIPAEECCNIKTSVNQHSAKQQALENYILDDTFFKWGHFIGGQTMNFSLLAILSLTWRQSAAQIAVSAYCPWPRWAKRTLVFCRA